MKGFRRLIETIDIFLKNLSKSYIKVKNNIKNHKGLETIIQNKIRKGKRKTKTNYKKNKKLNMKSEMSRKSSDGLNKNECTLNVTLNLPLLFLRHSNLPSEIF